MRGHEILRLYHEHLNRTFKFLVDEAGVTPQFNEGPIYPDSKYLFFVAFLL